MKNYVELILDWYLENKRALPWRKDKDPYHIWISEIMLQQTRIEVVIDYYQRFVKKIPSIHALSNISEDELLKLWEGLGYYSRARNLKKAAEKIMKDFDGHFPENYDAILSLPGIGEYTAGAIASICYNQKEVAIDGNVMRVYCRVNNLDLDVSLAKTKKEIGEALKKILPEDSGDFNQGIMELGEVICIPGGTPKCQQCPLQYQCLAHLKNREYLIPRHKNKTKTPEEEYTLFLLKCRDKIAIRKRNTGLLKNMYEFPNEKGFLTYDEVKEIIPYILNIKLSITNTHIFTHKKWYMNSYMITVEKEFGDYLWLPISEIEKNYAIPTAFMPFFHEIKKDN